MFWSLSYPALVFQSASYPRCLGEPLAKAKGEKGQKVEPQGPSQAVTQAMKRSAFCFWHGDGCQAFYMLDKCSVTELYPSPTTKTQGDTL